MYRKECREANIVTFDIARLLREIGFYGGCWYGYYQDYMVGIGGARKPFVALRERWRGGSKLVNPKRVASGKSGAYLMATAPTINQVREWLLKRYDIAIYVVVHHVSNNYSPEYYATISRPGFDHKRLNFRDGKCHSYKCEYDAYIDGFDYVINNLINPNE